MATMRMVLGEDACMTSIGDLAERMRSAIADHPAVELDLGDATRADLTVIQLIEAARREAARCDRALTLAAPATPAFAALLDRAGFLTAATSADHDFWFHGALPQ